MIDAFKTVLSGLVGIRRKADHERASVSPARIVIAAIAVVALLILSLVAIVRVVTS